ncbi:PREDICTED: uncharacterized protein LOC108758196 [Trachymyrmex cornetzi]|uniref:uncharacterized protein LOC108758196 n=1 Tax=Trachymyrmex cornetzi TaxID=471704 RepID=UPI00084F0345|nr:PREDICTED: uncharacterized protein LOC108758196 [Trachymyrmex cornetzi]
MLTGADTIAKLTVIRDEVIQLLMLGTLELSKWASNCPELLNLDDRKREPVTISDNATHSRILGMQWNRCLDTFQFPCESESKTHQVVSKRIILSEIATLFDPLGLLGPMFVTAKLILQDLWQLFIQCDESVPLDIHTRWVTFKEQMAAVGEMNIPRCVKPKAGLSNLQLHGFCDASQRAYGACVYVRTQLRADHYHSELLCSKSRVAPLKVISLPRLELSAALLLARLVHRSRGNPTLNREYWCYVASPDNPADILSRGSSPRDLIDSERWWNGPEFLKWSQERWPAGSFARLEDDLPERVGIRVTASVTNTSQCAVSSLLNKHSSLSKICRIVAYCLRLSKTHRADATSNFVSPTEMSVALNCVCRVVQRQAFHSEYQALSKGGVINITSNLLSLSPFLDENGLMRVGGRLKNSDLTFEACHPILLPRKHILTQRIIEHEHVRNLHAGMQATMAFVRQRFWPLSLRSNTRGIIKKCVACFRAKPGQSEALMSSLPAARVSASRAFSHCGVDYAGPFLLREGKQFKNPQGVPLNFRVLRHEGGTFGIELYDVYNGQQIQAEIKHFLRELEISWSFIPPNAPHFGGLWEAAVKSAKHHMTRIVGKALLTFEEMQTIFCEIEAILNSRPLAPLSSDPNDLAYLSPGHFLVGTALNGLPGSDLSNINENKLLRWQRLEQTRQHFWRRWSNEYLNSLQARTKWMINKGTQLSIDQLVLIKQQNLPPLQWVLGRVQEIHPGPDGIARAATVKTVKGSYTRPLAKLAILPIEG